MGHQRADRGAVKRVCTYWWDESFNSANQSTQRHACRRPPLPLQQHIAIARSVRTVGHEWRPFVGEHLVDKLADDAGLEDALPVHVQARDGAVRVDVLCMRDMGGWVGAWIN